MSQTLFSALLLTIAAAFLFSLWGLSPSARWIPLLVAVPTVMLLLLRCFQDIKSVATNNNSLRAEFKVFVWLLVLPVMAYLFGFLLAAPLYLLLFARLWACESWPKALFTAFAVAASLLALKGLLKIQLDGGLLWEYLA